MRRPTGRIKRRGLKAVALAACLAAVCHAAAVRAGQSSAGQDPPAATPQLGGFAFPDRAGGRLMLLGALSHLFDDLRTFSEMEKAAPTIPTAFCSGGRAIPVTFDGRQPADGKGNGRQSRSQFEHLEGLVFSLPAGERLQESATCLLAPEVLLRALHVVPLAHSSDLLPSPKARPCTAALTQRVASRRSRGLEQCWPLAGPNAPGAPGVSLVVFARRGNSALASLVVEDGPSFVFADLPGDYAREGSVWRVDDGGEIGPQWFDVLLLARRGGRLLLAFAWQGAEGRVLRLLESEGDRFRELLGESWYQAPI